MPLPGPFMRRLNRYKVNVDIRPALISPTVTGIGITFEFTRVQPGQDVFMTACGKAHISRTYNELYISPQVVG